MNQVSLGIVIACLAVMMVAPCCALTSDSAQVVPASDSTTISHVQKTVTSAKPFFNPVAQVLCGIFFMCVIFTALLWAGGEWLKEFAKAAGWAILFFGALPHFGSWLYAMSTGNTPAAILIFMFLAFWLFLGTMLIKGQKNEMDKALLVVEPAMMFVVAFFGACFYGQNGHHRDLQLILLLGLLPIILFLWMSKLPIKPISKTGQVLARIFMLPLGGWAFYLLLHQTTIAVGR